MNADETGSKNLIDGGSSLTISNLPQGFVFAPAGAKVDAAAAAREFEALLIARLLKTAREAGAALGGSSTQTGAEGYMELAEEHVSRVMAQRGAFGIAQIVLGSLDHARSKADNLVVLDGDLPPEGLR